MQLVDRNDFVRKVVYSQVALYVGLLLCVLLAPASLLANSGFSYFGHHRDTVVPFALGFFISAYYLWRARTLLHGHAAYQAIYRGLGIIVPGLVLIVIAPAVGDGLLDLMHRIVGSIIFITQLILGFWLARHIRNDFWSWALLGLQFLGGVIALIYLAPPDGYSFEGQLLFQLAFSGLILHTLVYNEEKLPEELNKES